MHHHNTVQIITSHMESFALVLASITLPCRCLHLLSICCAPLPRCQLSLSVDLCSGPVPALLIHPSPNGKRVSAPCPLKHARKRNHIHPHAFIPLPITTPSTLLFTPSSLKSYRLHRGYIDFLLLWEAVHTAFSIYLRSPCTISQSTSHHTIQHYPLPNSQLLNHMSRQ
ncbi:hypothetical protein DM02DRAFT_381415 [Periconia macrospinosa]|uniref:Uncharacterized protein n=1 Tax=Periconia macrospinosa TaxID=97972 RepID=A0A2V1ECA6_9PLEO|nr:hypothetical protein DM02DRAFT_381415 [Periconia macrospinosa]